MKSKSFNDLIKEVKKKGFQPLPSNAVSGEEFEEWLRKPFEEDGELKSIKMNDIKVKLK